MRVDVGGWFRTADGAKAAGPSPWGPAAGGFGLRSTEAEIDTALRMLRNRSTMVLTGAGMSTGSGLPDYRGAEAVPRSPMLFQEFVSSDLSRQRYWARATVGWRAFTAAGPSVAHRALAALERQHRFSAVVTQNVDGLHQAAGSSRVVDLHGRLSRVVCLDCDDVVQREAFQCDLLAMNPGFAAQLEELSAEAEAAPDGDAEVDRTEGFRYPDCRRCGGILKPDVVFFGENARKEVSDEARAAFDAAEALLVLGSSLTVLSGRRFLKYAARGEKPIVIVNDGYTRGDELATARVFGRLEDVLTRWLDLG